MPLPDHGCLIAIGTEHFCHIVALWVHGIGQGLYAIEVTILAGEDAGAAGSTDRVGDEAVVELHSSGGNSVDVRGLVYLAAIGADGMGGVIVGHDEDDVRTLLGSN